jgi:hypothetical protein
MMYVNESSTSYQLFLLIPNGSQNDCPLFLQNFQSILPDVSYKMNFLGLLVNPGFIGGSKYSETLSFLTILWNSNTVHPSLVSVFFNALLFKNLHTDDK